MRSIALAAIAVIFYPALTFGGPLKDDGTSRESPSVLKPAFVVPSAKPPDCKSIVDLIKKQAEQGDTAAQIHLGNMYFNGYDVQRNTDEALKWYHEAAQKGDTYAQKVLGALYYNGDHVKQDYTEAMKWTRMAADRNDSDAQKAVAEMFERGHGVKRDDVEAYFWYSLAGKQIVVSEELARIATHFTSRQKAAVFQRIEKWEPLPAQASAIYRPQLLTCAEYRDMSLHDEERAR